MGETERTMKVLHVGATGLVGRQALAMLLAEPRVTAVVAPTRRELPFAHPKLAAPVVDFDRLPEDADWWAADAVVCTLGSTLRQAGSREAFRRIDHDYPLAVARLAQRHGAQAFALNSAMGADARSRVFYSRTKGELEDALAQLGFRSLTLVRPGLIGGERDELRFGERMAGVALRGIGPLLPRRYRINPAGNIAAALAAAVLEPRPGTHVVTSAQLA